MGKKPYIKPINSEGFQEHEITDNGVPLRLIGGYKQSQFVPEKILESPMTRRKRAFKAEEQKEIEKAKGNSPDRQA